MKMAKGSTGYFPNGKQLQCKMESKYVGYLLLEFYQGHTTWQK
jgi:hypothetical protein